MAVQRAAIIVKVKSELCFGSEVWCAECGGLITAPDAKGQKEAEKGLKGKI